MRKGENNVWADFFLSLNLTLTIPHTFSLSLLRRGEAFFGAQKRISLFFPEKKMGNGITKKLFFLLVGNCSSVGEGKGRWVWWMCLTVPPPQTPLTDTDRFPGKSSLGRAFWETAVCARRHKMEILGFVFAVLNREEDSKYTVSVGISQAM